MNKQNKIILIVFFFLCIFAVAAGIYLFPKDAPLPSGIDDTPPRKTSVPEPEQGDANGTIVFSAEKTFPAGQANAGASAKSAYISYPENLIALLGIDMDEMAKDQDAFKNTIIHSGWMDRINEILKGLSPEKREAIIKNHTALLYIKDKLNEAYLTGKIDHETFKKALADLMKWHQRTYEAILSRAEYEALFEISPEIVDDTIDELIDQTPEYSFILNQNIQVEEVKEQVQGYKLEEVNSHFKKMIFDRDQIGKQINAGEMTLEQARAALNKSQHAFIAQCKEILTEDEINTIFGSVTALETGASQEKPAVLGDSDKIELGFEIENPETSIDHVKEKIDKNKIEDIKFFYQERDTEREELISRLDTGEISSEELENISKEMDAAFEENCRDILTREEYQLIYGNPDTTNPAEQPVPEKSGDSGKTKSNTENDPEKKTENEGKDSAS